MNIFITSSWINKHAVVMLSILLEQEGFKVSSFVFDNDNEVSSIGQSKDVWGQSIDYGEWVYSKEGDNVFARDIANIAACKVMIVIEPAGRDSWAHIGMAFSLDKKIYGLNSRGRKVGLMRRLVLWCPEYDDLIRTLKEK